MFGAEKAEEMIAEYEAVLNHGDGFFYPASSFPYGQMELYEAVLELAYSLIEVDQYTKEEHERFNFILSQFDRFVDDEKAVRISKANKLINEGEVNKVPIEDQYEREELIKYYSDKFPRVFC